MVTASAVQITVVATAQAYRANGICRPLSELFVPAAGRIAVRSVVATVMTSNPRAPITSWTDAEGRRIARHPRRFGAPTITRVACLVWAYSIRVSAAEGPSRVT